MKIGIRFSVFAFISTLVLSIVAISPSARAVSVSFNQVSWQNGNGGYLDQNSQYGEADVSFSGADLSSMTPDGSGGYYAWLNVVTSVTGGSNNNWAVQNQLVSFNSLSDLEGGDFAASIDFDLGQTDGTAVGSLKYGLELDSSPLLAEPNDTLSTVSVAAVSEDGGTEEDPNDVGGEGAGPASDTVGAPAGTIVRPSTPSTITGNLTNVPAINEAVNGCAPGAKARSISYLSKMFPASVTVTQSPQQIYGTLTNLMGSSTGPNSTGTSIAGITNGANAYFTMNGLSIGPTLLTNGAGYLTGALNCLNSTGDVEVGINWGSTNLVQGGTNFVVALGGHMAFVAGITPMTNSAGQTLAYSVKYIEDTYQGDGNAANNVKYMTILPNGTVLGTPTNIMGRGVTGFFLENVVAVPEPSSVAMAALGLGALASSIVFRRRKRNRT